MVGGAGGRWGSVAMMLLLLLLLAVLGAGFGQEDQLRRQGSAGAWVQGGGARGEGPLHRDVLGEEAGLTLTREERRRLKAERRQARLQRMEQREERRRLKQQLAGRGEEAVDVAWLRANLSALWQEFRTFTRSLERRQAGRGAGERLPNTGVPRVVQVQEELEDLNRCPTEVDGCRDLEGGDICSGHGQCVCGHCQCHPEYYGSTCQCSDHTCRLYDGMPCGGPSRGQCRCGECMCRPDHVGEDCSCPTHTHSCVQPGSDKLCSDAGSCECGRCSCGDGYKGMFCEDSVYAARVCETLKACVVCRAWGRELAKCAQCQVTVSVVEMLEPSMTTCVMVNSGCILKYSYVHQAADTYSVLLERNTECPPLIL